MWSNIIFERDKNRKQYLKALKRGYNSYSKDSKQIILKEVVGDKD